MIQSLHRKQRLPTFAKHSSQPPQAHRKPHVRYQGRVSTPLLHSAGSDPKPHVHVSLRCEARFGAAPCISTRFVIKSTGIAPRGKSTRKTPTCPAYLRGTRLPWLPCARTHPRRARLLSVRTLLAPSGACDMSSVNDKRTLYVGAPRHPTPSLPTPHAACRLWALHCRQRHGPFERACCPARRWS